MYVYMYSPVRYGGKPLTRQQCLYSIETSLFKQIVLYICVCSLTTSSEMYASQVILTEHTGRYGTPFGASVVS
jgi:hypothetical protein